MQTAEEAKNIPFIPKRSQKPSAYCITKDEPLCDPSQIKAIAYLFHLGFSAKQNNTLYLYSIRKQTQTGNKITKFFFPFWQISFFMKNVVYNIKIIVMSSSNTLMLILWWLSLTILGIDLIIISKWLN